MMTKTAARGAYTPWGTSQHSEPIAPEIVFYSTAGHGGAFVPPDIRAEWPAALRDFPTFTGGNWYEEDCDLHMIILAHPARFTASQVAGAVDFARGYCKDYAPAVSQWVRLGQDEHAQKLRDTADLYNALHSGK